VTGQSIEVAAVPTVADLRARKIELMQAKLRETIVAGELDAYRGVIAALAEEFDLMDIAAAALKQGDPADAEGEAAEIPAAAPARERHPAREREAMRAERRPAPGAKPGVKPAGKGPRSSGGPVAKLYIGAGRKTKLRPGDLVGAIANETGMDATAIGAIQILERHSIVEVPDALADEVVAALTASTIKGKKVLVRRDRA
jgi:ATP-dependent RNA helicase DeaD